jgi:hypothetical protein
VNMLVWMEGGGRKGGGEREGERRRFGEVLK